MANTSLVPNSDNPLRFAWEADETMVEQRRRKLRYRLQRFVSNNWLLTIVIVLLVWALLDASVMRIVLGVGSFLFQLALRISFSLLYFVFIFWFLGRTRTYTIMPGAEGVSFEDYRGQPELLDQAKQIVKLLRGVKVFEEAGGEPLNGLLLEGPPGTGKTWLAQAISTEAGVPFFYIDASSLNSMFIGVAPMKVAGLYRKARRAAREYGASVIFIDEIDAVGARGGVSMPEREAGSEPSSSRLNMMFGMGGNMILPTLLVEMSGFSLEHGWWARKKRWFYQTFLRRKPPKPNKRVLTIGATNRIQALDPALLRPGRFDKKIRIDAPDMEGRRDIIEYYLSKMAHDETMDPLILAAETQNYTPADLKYLLNEALRYALFDGRTYMSYRDFRLAQPEHEMGLRSPIKNLSREAKYGVAAHEAGHAIALRVYMPRYRISRITIIRQGQAYGHVSFYPALEEYDHLSTYEQMMNDLRMSVAGKAGEMEFVHEGAQTLGVGGDFGWIRFQLFRMANAGMFGPLGANFNGSNYPPDMREAMEDTFKQALEEVRLLLRAQRKMGEALIELLMEKNELLADEVEAFFDQYGLYTPKVLLPDRVPADKSKEEMAS